MILSALSLLFISSIFFGFVWVLFMGVKKVIKLS